MIMVLLVRPALSRVLALRQTENDKIGPQSLALVFIALLASALTTELIGIHALFGAFLLGAIIPGKSAIARILPERLEPVAVAEASSDSRT